MLIVLPMPGPNLMIILQELLGHLANRENAVNRDNKVLKEHKVCKAQVAQEEKRDHQDPEVKLGREVTLVQLEHKDQMDREEKLDH